MASNVNREIQLDVIRGVAILLAMGWHLNGDDMRFAVSDGWLFPGRMIGWAGVDLFFVLSGFLVGGLVLREVQKSRAFDYKRFLIRRAFRLWPVLYIYLAAQMLLGDRPWNIYLPQIVLHIQNFAETPLKHLWSLAVEEQFYLLVGLLIPLSLRRGITAEHVRNILVVIIFGSAIIRPIASLLGVDGHTIQIQTQFRLDGLAIGVLLALLFRRYPEAYQAMQRNRLLNGFLAIFFFLLLFFTSTAMRPTLGYTAAALGSGFAILAVHQSDSPIWRGLIAKGFAWFGLYSYPMYIWHNGVGNQITPKLARFVGIENPDLIVLLKYALTALVAYAMSKAVEQPFMSLRDRYFAGKVFSSNNHVTQSPN